MAKVPAFNIIEFAERPILFSGSMVRAILSGRKTQTRRVVKLDNAYHECGRHEISEFRQQDGKWFGLHGWNTVASLCCPYGKPGDRLWVRETFAIYRDEFNQDEGDELVLFQADDSAWHRLGEHYGLLEADFNPIKEISNPLKPKWKPSIHMPRWASRITLEIESVRVERLNDISEEDAIKEGAAFDENPDFDEEDPCDDCEFTFKAGFMNLWESINGPDSWLANPWVWVVSFRKLSP